MKSIIWTDNETLAEKLMRQVVGDQTIIRRWKTASEYCIEYGEDDNIVHWFRPTNTRRGFRCDVSYIDVDTCSLQVITETIEPLTSFGKYGRYFYFSGGEQLTNDEQLKWIKSVLAHRADVQDHKHDGNRLE